MKCDKCVYLKFHSAGLWQSVAEGYDDPYNYQYCGKFHWEGDLPEPQNEKNVEVEDPYINCKDFKIKDDLLINNK